MAKYVGFKTGKVHENHVISEYYCGGCGYPVTDHDSFCPECGGAFRKCDADDLESENAKLRELVWDMYCLAYPSTVEWKVADAVYDKYSPCEKCHELHGGKSPCAGTSKDMSEEYCEPIQAAVVANRMRKLGIEVPHD